MKNLSAKILTVSAFCLVVFGCKKNDGKGRLSISLKSVSATTFNYGDPVSFVLEFNHPTSGNTKDTLLIKRNFFSCPFTSVDSSKNEVPSFYADADIAGEYQYNFIYGKGAFTGPCSNGGTNPKKDSVFYTFILIDKDNNRSDSVVSPKIILNK